MFVYAHNDGIKLLLILTLSMELAFQDSDTIHVNESTCIVFYLKEILFLNKNSLVHIGFVE